MRTTIRLDDALLSAAKREAARVGSTLTAIIEESLRERLNRQQLDSVSANGRVELETFGGDGVLPGVDLNDSALLIDVMGGSKP